MCLIIDANLAAEVFRLPTPKAYVPIVEWLFSPRKDGRLVLGGQLSRELNKVGAARRFVLQLNRAGRARVLPGREVAAEEDVVRAIGVCKSDDPHVIALARLSGARTLCSQDGDLHRDFKNTKLIANPRGCVYQDAGHAHILRHTDSCRRVIGQQQGRSGGRAT